MAVDIFEREPIRIADRHQLDHPEIGMARVARYFVKLSPAPEILLNVLGEAGQERLDAGLVDDIGEALDADEPGHVLLPVAVN
jgi:nucleoside-triphosphatase THEP1